MRAGAYSPNHVGNDAAIFNAVAEYLRQQGYPVTIYSEEQLCNGEVAEPIIVNMCRDMRSIKLLQQLEKEENRLVINSAFGIENCTRERMTRILIEEGIPHPESLIVDTNEVVEERLHEAGFTACWIKRGDFHAMHKEDVSYVRHPQEAQEILQEYALRGIKRAVINRHLEGDLVKFYGVTGTPFFYWFYPLDMNHSKFGHEAINGKATGIAFDATLMSHICSEAGRCLHVDVYGGDCIISPDGKIRIIDFNDWPSFAPCRDEAVPHIATRILIRIHHRR